MFFERPHCNHTEKGTGVDSHPPNLPAQHPGQRGSRHPVAPGGRPPPPGGDIAALNAAWGTVFWSQAYGSFAEVDLPNLAVTEANPAAWLDFYRYSSDAVPPSPPLPSGTEPQHSMRAGGGDGRQAGTFSYVVVFSWWMCFSEGCFVFDAHLYEFSIKCRWCVKPF